MAGESGRLGRLERELDRPCSSWTTEDTARRRPHYLQNHKRLYTSTIHLKVLYDDTQRVDYRAVHDVCAIGARFAFVSRGAAGPGGELENGPAKRESAEGS